MASKRQPVQCYLMSPPREWCPRNVNIQHVLVLLCFLLGCICSCFVLHGTACGWLVTELHNLFQQAFSHEIVSPWSYALALFYTWLTTYDRKNYSETGPLYYSFCTAICNQELCTFITNSGGKFWLQNGLAWSHSPWTMTTFQTYC